MTGSGAEVIDAHLHLWRLPRSPGDTAYAWITPELGPLHRDIEAEEAGRELASSGVDGAVLVQADDTLADTQAMLDVCDTHPWAVGVVGWVPLEDPVAAAHALGRWERHPAFRGVRHLVHADPRPDFLTLPGVRESLALLADADLALDVPDAYPRHLHQVLDVVRDLHRLRVVVDHLAKPPLADGPGSRAFTEWEGLLRAVAEAPSAVAKVSGLRIPGAAYDLDTLRPALEVALDAFGPDRLMYGGDWPMTLPGGGYAPTLAPLRAWAAELSPEDAARLWSGTARRVYRLPAPPPR